MSTPSFESFGLQRPIVDALGALGFESPTPIQSAAVPVMLKGTDLIARARTGSGKTAAFGLPLLERIQSGRKGVSALVLAPTRELALQVTQALRSYAKGLPVRIACIYGGAAYGPQLAALEKGSQIVVGTPGRVLDHMRRGSLKLSALEVLVLDEADEMLRMGFLEDVEQVLEASPDDRQVALFSATMPEPIQRVASRHLRDPELIQVESRSLSVEHIDQRWVVTPQGHKIDALERVLAAEGKSAALVFARTRAGCGEIADELARRGVHVDALHGDLNQASRERVLQRLRSRQLDLVVATDVAARGIDVEHLTHVINFDLPNDPETYVHRIGRTARAGRSGSAISLVTPKEVGRIKWLERKLKVPISEMEMPSDAAIASRGRERLLKTLLDAIENPSGGAEAVVDELSAMATHRDIAAAAIALAAKARNLDLDSEADPRPPAWARPSKHQGAKAAKTPRVPQEDEVELCVTIGRFAGVRPKDLVGALANEGGIPGAAIGRIAVLDRKSFVRVQREAAETILDTLSQVVVRGRKARVSVARETPAASGPSGSRPPSRSRAPSRSRRAPRGFSRAKKRR